MCILTVLRYHTHEKNLKNTGTSMNLDPALHVSIESWTSRRQSEALSASKQFSKAPGGSRRKVTPVYYIPVPITSHATDNPGPAEAGSWPDCLPGPRQLPFADPFPFFFRKVNILLELTFLWGPCSWFDLTVVFGPIPTLSLSAHSGHCHAAGFSLQVP